MTVGDMMVVPFRTVSISNQTLWPYGERSRVKTAFASVTRQSAVTAEPTYG
jgi:hypothetical protein